MEENFNAAAKRMQQLAVQLNAVIKGKPLFIEQLLTAFFAGGHVLIEDAPGLGKTTAAKALAKLIKGSQASRIQCTSDLLPYDITGVDVYEGASGKFHFEQGPVFTDILLADEINRASPKTQSALLEAMAERQVTVSGRTYKLSDLFFVAATQNPVESEGAYNLPAAELDRFMLKISPGYPAFEDECAIVKNEGADADLAALQPMLELEEALAVKEAVSNVYCDDKIIAFAVKLSQASRCQPQIALGVSPRGSVNLIKAAKARALFFSRNYTTDEDISALAGLCYAHRIICKSRHDSAFDLITALAEEVKQEVFN